MDEMMKVITQYPNGTGVRVEWGSGDLRVEGVIDTVYETNNGQSQHAAQYKEFYACLLRVELVMENKIHKDCTAGSLLEISPANAPSRIALQDGTIIWGA
jgi:hypothetical protein